MGMYDHVNFETTCPQCGGKVTDFQTKDGPRMLSNMEIWEVNNFYSSCTKCKIWIEYNIDDHYIMKLKEKFVTLDKFERIVKYPSKTQLKRWYKDEEEKEEENNQKEQDDEKPKRKKWFRKGNEEM